MEKSDECSISYGYMLHILRLTVIYIFKKLNKSISMDSYYNKNPFKKTCNQQYGLQKRQKRYMLVFFWQSN
jgi:hypothetical protein